jgi:phosphoribosyl-AMP cyclohydrolase
MGLDSALDFEKSGGLVMAIAVDHASGDVLMTAWMNREAFQRTVETGEVVYWSRSRQKLWRKGETSGHVQRLRSLFVDCDGDAVLLRVEQVGGAACHTGRRSCFFRRAQDGQWIEEGERVFDPEEVYGR